MWWKFLAIITAALLSKHVLAKCGIFTTNYSMSLTEITIEGDPDARIDPTVRTWAGDRGIISIDNSNFGIYVTTYDGYSKELQAVAYPPAR